MKVLRRLFLKSRKERPALNVSIKDYCITIINLSKKYIKYQLEPRNLKIL